jgi:enamine deaminase RidA (YjgF/YER057c/UK114 family)
MRALSLRQRASSARTLSGAANLLIIWCCWWSLCGQPTCWMDVKGVVLQTGIPASWGNASTTPGWLQLTSNAPWTARSFHTIAEVLPTTASGRASNHTRLLLVAGKDLTATLLNDVWEMDSDTGAWQQLPLAPWAGRGNLASVVTAAGLLLLMGGYTQTTSYLNEVVAFDPRTNSWTIWPAATWLPRIGHGGTVCGSRVIVAGGYTSAGWPSDVWFADIPGLSAPASWTQATPAAAFPGRSAMALHCLGTTVVCAFGDRNFHPFGEERAQHTMSVTATIQSNSYGRTRARSMHGRIHTMSTPDTYGYWIANDTSLATWTQITWPTKDPGSYVQPASIVERAYLQSVVWRGNVAFISGDQGGSGGSSTVTEILTSDAGFFNVSTPTWTWTDITHPPASPGLRRTLGAAGTFQGQLVLLGGKRWSADGNTAGIIRLADVWVRLTPQGPWPCLGMRGKDQCFGSYDESLY